MMDIFGIYWAGLSRFIYAPIFLFFIYGVFRNYKRIKAGTKILCHEDQSDTIFRYFSLTRSWLKALCLGLALIFLFLALLQPQWGTVDQKVIQEGRDVLIMLDISRSMCAQDIKPNRLDFAKLKIKQLVAKLACERIGLMVFSGSAFVHCPLTADHAAFLSYLDYVDTEMISSGTTALDRALARAIEVFKNAQERKNKIVFLLTDGEDFSQNLDAVKGMAAGMGIRLFTLGVGTPEGAPIPIKDNLGNQIGFEQEKAGTPALSKLNEQLLQTTSDFMGGTYIRATYSDNDIRMIEQKIKQTEKEKFGDRTISHYHEQYPWFLAVAWFLLALEWIL